MTGRFGQSFARAAGSDRLKRMHRDIDRVLIPQEQIAARVRELAAQITADHTRRAARRRSRSSRSSPAR